MIRHLFKLVWNRKRTNALIILEIFFAFLVLFIVGTLGIFLWDNIHQPLGFSSKDVWTVGRALRAAANYFNVHFQSVRNFGGGRKR